MVTGHRGQDLSLGVMESQPTAEDVFPAMQTQDTVQLQNSSLTSECCSSWRRGSCQYLPRAGIFQDTVPHFAGLSLSCLCWRSRRAELQQPVPTLTLAMTSEQLMPVTSLFTTPAGWEHRFPTNTSHHFFNSHLKIYKSQGGFPAAGAAPSARHVLRRTARAEYPR